MKANRNDPCPCGSGKKYKHCCEGKTPLYKQPLFTGTLVLLLLLGAALLVWSSSSSATAEGPGSAPPGKVWSPEHGHYH